MFGQNRKRRFEKAVQEEIAYMLDLHGEGAAQAAAERARRPNLPASRIRVLEEAAARLKDRGQAQPREARPAGGAGSTSA